jgi:hypothetical protein
MLPLKKKAMNNEQLHKKMGHLLEKIDNPPERDRICLYCNESFFANKLDKYYCSDKCYQSNYNERVRPLKEFNKLYEEQMIQQEEMDRFKNSLNNQVNTLRRNKEIIDDLNIDPLIGAHFPKILLAKLGLNFKFYDYREKIPNTKDSFELIIGNNRLTLIDENSIKIKTTKNHD